MKNKTFFKFGVPSKYSIDRIGMYNEYDMHTFIFSRFDPVGFKQCAKISFIMTNYEKKDLIKTIKFKVYGICNLDIKINNLVTVYIKSDNLSKCFDLKLYSHKMEDTRQFEKHTYEFIAEKVDLENIDGMISPFIEGFNNKQPFYGSIVINGILEAEELNLEKEYEAQEEKRFKALENLMNEMLEEAKKAKESENNEQSSHE